MKITIGKCPFDIERLEREVNILVISDLHYNISKKPEKDYPGGDEINKILVKSIEAAGSEWEPDVVLIAGDLVNKCEPENYIQFFDLVDQLVTKYPNLKNTIYCTPGNHDVTRPATGSTSLTDKLKTLRDGKTKEVYGISDTVKEFYALARNPIIGDSRLKPVLLEFEKEYFKTYLEKQSELRTHHPFNGQYPVEGIETSYIVSTLGINIVSHNSSFFCDLAKPEKDRNNLFMMLDLVKETVKATPAIGPVISFMHHPYFYLHESEYISPIIEKETDKEIFNCFSRILRSSDLVISGHVHGDLQDPTLQQHHAYLITNGTSYTQDPIESMCYPFTFALIKVNKQRNWFAMKKFIYRHELANYIDESSDNTHHYPFVYREQTEAPSLEAEKLRVIDHMMKLDISDPHERNYRSMAYQLGLYDPEFRILENAKKEFLFYSEVKYGKETVMITCPGMKKSIRVCLMNGPRFFNELYALLPEWKKEHDPSTIIYCSLPRKQYMNGDAVNATAVQATISHYRNYILCMKSENVGIDILYH